MTREKPSANERRSALRELITGLEWGGPTSKRVRGFGMVIVLLILGAVVRPFFESLAGKLGENVGSRLVSEAGAPRALDLSQSQVASAQYKVAVINRTETIPDNDVQRVLPALQMQVHRDLAPAWGVDAQLTLVKRGEAPEPGYWWLELADTSASNSALAYHDVTPDGLPRSRVFPSIATAGHMDWTVAASHELIDMLVNPRVNLSVIPQPPKGRAYALEVAIPCQLDTYQISGVVVSDFVFPSWFDSARPPRSTQFDFLRLIDGPLQIRPGGYADVIGPNLNNAWQQIFK